MDWLDGLIKIVQFIKKNPTAYLKKSRLSISVL